LGAGAAGGGAEVLAIGLKLESFIEGLERVRSKGILLAYHCIDGEVTADLMPDWKCPSMLVSGDHGVGNPKLVSTKPSSGLRGWNVGLKGGTFIYCPHERLEVASFCGAF
jgi:hypothetical protein